MKKPQQNIYTVTSKPLAGGKLILVKIENAKGKKLADALVPASDIKTSEDLSTAISAILRSIGEPSNIIMECPDN